MIDLDFLQSLIQAIDLSGLDSLELERGGTRIKLSKTPPTAGALAAAPVPAAQAAPAAPSVAAPPAAGVETASDAAAPPSDLIEIKSPMVGTFYLAPAPDAPPYAEVGTRVSPGDTLCIIEAMKLMNELESEVSGVIQEVCVDNSDPVEFGQVLYRLSPS
jgi:acetyl-CoA carboxylase biotin carboxyl carrier protein